jgi:ribose/xylose/arabinose/galactoside ABC-type transport system permease subunit
MAKKKHRKKHNFKYTTPSQVSPAPASATATSGTAAQPSKATAAVRPAAQGGSIVANLEEFSYVKRDLAKVGMLAVGFVALQFVLWYLFEHTGLGNSVYHLIKL